MVNIVNQHIYYYSGNINECQGGQSYMGGGGFVGVRQTINIICG